MARKTSPQTSREDGFTVVEMAVTIAVIAAIFVAVAVVLDSGLRALAASKARARANNVATQGIEDLQRFGFNNLGLCEAPSGTAPQGLGDTVILPNCPATPNPALYEEPCSGKTGSVPQAEYMCVRNNIEYTVKRYVAWVDPLRTTKRLAVFVEWTDSAGRHQVAQQSSLRAPDQSAITGLAPPKFSSAPTAVGTPNPIPLTSTFRLDGAANAQVTFSATTSNLNAPAATTPFANIPAHSPNAVLDITVVDETKFPTYNGYPITIGTESFTVIAGAGTKNWRVVASGSDAHPTTDPVRFAGDRVFATVQVIGANNAPQSETVFLQSNNGTNWSRTLDSSSTLRFGAGSQYVSFGILRASDGKSSSAFATPALEFCPASGGCAGIARPVVKDVNVPAAVALGPSGELVNDVVVKVTTENITNADTVTFSFLTQAGSVTVAMTRDAGAPTACPGPDTASAGVTCYWVGTISKSVGYRFSAGPQRFYFGAAQILDTTNAASIDKGSTGAALSPFEVVFG